MHKVCYNNAYSTWDEALPIGNGHFGAMVYHEGQELIYAINHYDAYYKKLWLYSESYRNEREKEVRTDTSRYELIQERALKAHEDPNDPAHYNYNYTLDPEMKKNYGVDRKGITHSLSGELHLFLDASVTQADDFESGLHIEKAEHYYREQAGKDELIISTIVSESQDVILTRVSQTSLNKVRELQITVPERRYLEISAVYEIHNENTFYFINSFYPDGEDKEKYKPFRYIFMVRLVGVKMADGFISEDRLSVKIPDAANTFTVLTCVVTEEETENLLGAAIAKLDFAEGNLHLIYESHRKYWDDFWSKSAVHLPDQLLENLWYIHIYSLECSSGRGARLFEQACGLNGLWDIKMPSQWGNLWYWDVNIQQSYWPVYTSNHLEIGETFYKALLSYVNEAKQKAKEHYGYRGIAADYPFDSYMMCIWPWCAQYFWWHYIYSSDAQFLKDRAYPLFKDILFFFEDYLKYDEHTNQYYIFPDVSPEQGPVTRNSTISLACLRFLLRAALKANSILGEDEVDYNRWDGLLKGLPDYPIGESVEFVETIKDSEWSLSTQFLSTSAPLMPIYPVGDISKRCDEDVRKIGINTLKYVESMQATGTHNFGWEACAAARLGSGNDALRILYEKGIAFQMRSNGMFAEETERWIQNCLTASAPVYNPPLIEAGSAVVATINEMLLQSFNGIIEVFPALPKEESGKGDIGRYDSVVESSSSKVKEAWNDCYFEKLLAEGGFEISAYRAGNRTSKVMINSLAGNEVKLINPFLSCNVYITCEGSAVDFTLTNNMIHFKTEAGNRFEITESKEDVTQGSVMIGDHNVSEDGRIPTKDAEVYITPARRRVFLGKNEDTEFLRALDQITFDYYQGDIQTSRVAVYRFDFSQGKEQLAKDYESVLPRQYHGCGKMGLDFIRITKDIKFTPYTGFGWEDTIGLQYVDRMNSDPFRRDFIGGSKANQFKIELPRGQYQIFIAAGDYAQATYTAIEINGQQKWKPDSFMTAGKFAVVVLPVVQNKDGVLVIHMSTIPEFEWKVNMMIVNRLL